MSFSFALKLDESLSILLKSVNGIGSTRTLIFNLATSGKLVPKLPNELHPKDLLGSFKREIPAHESVAGWLSLNLSDCAEIYNGNSTSATEKAGMERNKDGLNYIATKDVGYGFESIKYNTGLRIGSKNNNFKIAPKNALLICLEGGSAGKKMGLVEQEIAFGNKLFAVVCKSWIDPRYLLIYFLSSKFQSDFQAQMSGIIGGISKAKFSNLQIPTPPLEEQRRIVNKVIELMNLCDGLETKLAFGNSLRTAARRSAVDSISNARDKDEFQIAWDRIQENWEVIAGTPEAIDSLRKLILSFAATGKLVDSADRFTNNSTTIELLKVCKVSWGNLSLTKSAYIENGPHLAVSAAGPDGRIGIAEHKAYTPVLSAIGARCGTMFMPEEDFTAIKNTMTLEPKDELLDNWYLFYTMMGSDLPRRGSAQPFMSKSDIENFKIRVPSMNEQKLISKSVEALLEKCDLLESKLKDLEKIAEQFARSVVLRST